MMQQRGVGFSKAHSMFQLNGAMEDLGLSPIRRNSLMAAALRSGDLERKSKEMSGIPVRTFLLIFARPGLPWQAGQVTN